MRLSSLFPLVFIYMFALAAVVLPDESSEEERTFRRQGIRQKRPQRPAQRVRPLKTRKTCPKCSSRRGSTIQRPNARVDSINQNIRSENRIVSSASLSNGILNKLLTSNHYSKNEEPESSENGREYNIAKQRKTASSTIHSSGILHHLLAINTNYEKHEERTNMGVFGGRQNLVNKEPKLSKEESCEESAESGNCRRRQEGKTVGGNGEKERNDKPVGGNGGEDRGDPGDTDGTISPTTTCIPNNTPKVTTTRPSLPEIPAQLRAISNKLLTIIGAKSEDTGDSNGLMQSSDVSSSIHCIPVQNTEKPVTRDDDDDDDGRRKEITDNTLTMTTTCVPEDNSELPATQPSLPMIPAQLIKVYHRVLRAIGVKSNEPEGVLYKASRCVTKTPLAEDGNGDEEDQRGEVDVEVVGKGVDRPTLDNDEKDSSDSLSTTHSPSTTCIPDSELPVTRHSLPEIPAQLSSIYNRVLRAIGARSDNDVDTNSLKTLRCVPKPTMEAAVTSTSDENDVFNGKEDGKEGGKEEEETDTTDKEVDTADNDGIDSDYEDLPDTTYSPPTTCVPDIDPELPVTRPSLPEIPAQLRDIYNSFLRVIGARSESDVNQRPIKTLRCVPKVTTEATVTNTGDENDAPDQGEEDEQVEREEEEETEATEKGASTTDDDVLNDKKETSKVPYNTLLVSTPCIPYDDPEVPVTRPSLPEIPAQLQYIYDSVLQSIGMRSASDVQKKRSKGSRCVPSYATEIPVTKDDNFLGEGGEAGRGQGETGRPREDVTTTDSKPKDGEEATEFSKVSENTPLPSTPCVQDNIPVTRTYLPEIPAQLSKLYNSVLRAIGAKSSDLDSEHSKSSAACVPNYATETTKVITGGKENGVDGGEERTEANGGGAEGAGGGKQDENSPLPPCGPDEVPVLPEVPAQLETFTDNMLLMIGIKSSNGNKEMRGTGTRDSSPSSLRCIPVKGTQTTDGVGDKEVSKIPDKTLSTQKPNGPDNTPDLTLMPYLPEIPAQLNDGLIKQRKKLFEQSDGPIRQRDYSIKQSNRPIRQRYKPMKQQNNPIQEGERLIQHREGPVFQQLRNKPVQQRERPVIKQSGRPVLKHLKQRDRAIKQRRSRIRNLK